MRRVKTAVIGTGFMGRVHSEAIRRVGHVDVVAVAGTREKETKSLAAMSGADRWTVNYKDIIADKEIDAVHICTPNATHFPMAMDAMKAGKAVLCEKPLTMDASEAKQMVNFAAANNIPNCVNHNLRYYPVVQHIRQMVLSGELGEILVVQGTYSQDWLLYDTDYNWRVDAAANGALRAMGDIGSHWMDMIQHVTGMKITSLCADLNVVHKTRKRPKVAIETFAGKTLQPEDYEEVPITTEDFGAVLVRLGDRARGAYTVSQVSAGCKNKLVIEVYGTKCGVSWSQERPDELWIGHRNAPNQLILKDPSLLRGPAAAFADLPGGHSEGYDDTHKQVFKRFYAKVADSSAPVDYPTFEEGFWGMHLLETALDSHNRRAWIDA